MTAEGEDCCRSRVLLRGISLCPDVRLSRVAYRWIWSELSYKVEQVRLKVSNICKELRGTEDPAPEPALLTRKTKTKTKTEVALLEWASRQGPHPARNV